MTRAPAPACLLSALLLSALAAPAIAGEAACWYENGVVVVTAEVAGVVGDYILDTGQPNTQLAETQAQGAGYEATALTADIRLAGVTLRGQSVEVADLDVRTGLHPTPIAGVLGADAFRGRVLDVAFAPCRIGVWSPAQAPRLPGARSLPLRPTAAGVGAIRVTVSDGSTGRTADLVPATGSDAAVRLADTLGYAPAGARPQELYPYGVRRPKLAALAFADEVWTEVPGGLLKPEAGVDGWIGAPVLARFRVRFDYARGRLRLARP